MNRREWFEQTSTVAVAAGLLTYAGVACSEDKQKKVRLAVAGGNFGATFSFHQHPNCVVSAVTDLLPERRDRLRAAYHCDVAYDSLEELLKKEKSVDAVALFTDAPLHVKHALMCFERGLHVLSAVPACTSVEEAQQLKEAKEKTGLRYMMAETSYYRPSCIYARNYFEQGHFGELFYSEAEYYHDKGNLQALNTNKHTRFWGPDGKHSWRWGYPPMHYPTHALGFLVGVTDERVTEVSCLGWGTKHEYLTDNVYENPYWNETALMRTNRGHAHRANVFWLVGGDGERATWYGDRATVLDENGSRHGPLLQVRSQGARRLVFPEYYRSDMLPEAMRHNATHGNSEVFISAEFINALVQNREPAIDIYRSLAMTVPGLVAHQSALKGGEQLKVPQFDRG
ncbi:MAG: Gfo/Idh/MocA family oxidoreductase [Polyangiales bacterium]|nr:Gfo/Idh/MocA family oxidoreductase [Myxococcales bacterium]